MAKVITNTVDIGRCLYNEIKALLA